MHVFQIYIVLCVHVYVCVVNASNSLKSCPREEATGYLIPVSSITNTQVLQLKKKKIKLPFFSMESPISLIICVIKVGFILINKKMKNMILLFKH